MPLWGKKDLANNSPQFVGALVKISANTNNRDRMFGNTAANVFVSKATIGVFGADKNEVAATPGVAHSGWQLRTVGSGGRAGRVTYETLVALRNITTDNEDAVLFDALIKIISQPGNKSAANNSNAYFSVNASIVPSGTITYRWQRDQGNGTWVNIASSVVFSGQNTSNLIISNVGWIGLANSLSGNVFRCILESTAASPVTTANSTLTVV